MTGPREELLRLVAELSEADPELRLGQMLTNLATLARGPQAADPYSGASFCNRLTENE